MGMQPATTGLRERKKERVREELIAAALKLFAERGYDQTTIDDIVAAVDVSRRSFFRYFASKEEILTAWIDARRERLRAALEARPADEPPFTSLRHVLTYLAGTFEADRNQLLVMERIVAGSQVARARKQEALARHALAVSEVFAQRLGLDAQKDLAPRLIGKVALAVASSAFDTWIASGTKASLPKLME